MSAGDLHFADTVANTNCLRADRILKSAWIAAEAKTCNTRAEPAPLQGPTMTLCITSAQPSDETEFRRLWAGFQEDYGLTLAEETTAATWARIIDPNHRMQCRLALWNGVPQGFAIHHHHCSTWVPGDDVYLEDLFVDPSARRRGLARALIEDLISIGKGNGWHRLYWNTNHDNAAARKLYDSICRDDGHIRYRMALR